MVKKNKDLYILKHLRNNSRVSLTELGRKTNSPISTVHDRVKTIEDMYVRKYTSLVDFSKLGYHSRTQLYLKVPVEMRRSLLEFITGCGNVNNVFLISDEYDLMLDLFFKTNKEYISFENDIKEKFDIERLKRVNVVEELKEESFFSEPDNLSHAKSS